jgi:hypothetical protein
MRNNKFFGFDRHFKSVYDGSIISFVEDSKRKIGHLWYHGQWNEWIISYHHLYSEWGYNVGKRRINRIKVLGFGERDEYILEQYRDSQT